jgi:hypothetical protein
MSSKWLSASVAENKRETALNGVLVLCAAPIFVYWLCLAFAILQVWIGEPSRNPVWWFALEMLFLFAPLCVAIGWVRLAKSGMSFYDRRLKSGRFFLVIATVLALPTVIFMILALIPLFIDAVSHGSVFN